MLNVTIGLCGSLVGDHGRDAVGDGHLERRPVTCGVAHAL
jgi:hypothetical protein